MPSGEAIRLRLASVATVAALGLGLAPGLASAASIGGFGVRPAHPNPRIPATRAYFIIHARRGGSRNKTVVVTNKGSKALVLDVDPVDGLTGVTSGLVYANRGVPIHGAGAWVTPDVRSVTVPARSSIDVGFTVKIPRHARKGDHVAGIAFQGLQPTRSGGSFAVTVAVRTVVGIEVIVRGHATRHLRMFALALAPLPGTTVPSAVVTLEDDGGKLCNPHLAVAITGQNATTKATQKLGTILPGDRIAYPFSWPGALSQGRYKVSARATHCGPPAAMRTVAVYSLKATPGTAAKPGETVAPTTPLASASTSTGWSWWLYALVGLGGMLAGVALARIAVRLRTRPRR